MEITLDTHVLVWYMDAKLNNKLSLAALNAIKEAETEGKIYLSVITLVEILYLIEKGRIKNDYDSIIKAIEQNDNHKIINLDINIIKEIESIKGLEIDDRIITATAKVTKSKLVSKDQTITNNYSEVIW